MKPSAVTPWTTRSGPPPTWNAARTAKSSDEIPMAYRDIDAVMHAQRELVEVVHTLRQVVCERMSHG